MVVAMRPSREAIHVRLPSWFPSVVLALALLLGGAGRSVAQVPAPAAPGPPPQEEPRAIPLAEIAVQADEVAAYLAEVVATAAPSREIQALEAGLPARRARIQESRDDTARRLDLEPPLAILDGLASSWQAVSAELRTSIDTATRSATQLQQEVDRLGALRDTWTRARGDAAAAQAPAVVLGRIDEIRMALSSTKAHLESRLGALTVLQHRLSQELTRCEQVLARIAQVRIERFERLTVRNGLPIWSARLWTGAAEQRSKAWREGLETFDRIAGRVARGQAGRLPIHAALSLALLALVYRARRFVRGRVAPADAATLGAVFDRPISAAVVLALFTGSLIYRQELWPFLYLTGLVAVVPVLRLMQPLVGRAATPGLYAFGALFLVDRLRLLIATATLLDQVAYVVEMLAATLLMAWLRATRRLPAFSGQETASQRATVAATLLVGAFAAAFVAGALGYMHLAHLIGGGALGSSYAALAISGAARVLSDLTVLALRVRPLRLLRVVQLRSVLIQQRALVAIRWAGTIAWVLASLKSFRVLPYLEGIVGQVLALPLGWGAVRPELGDVLAFAVSVWAAFLAARLTRFVLEEDVFPRVHLARGLPLALSRVVQYAIVMVGLSLATVALGVDFAKLTILLGALGVGVGFGLQSVVGDVAAGLILLIERSVRVGDAVRVGEVEGEMRAIGLRSSMIRTWGGAEVIVPNGELVSHTVTNWTFSDRRCRVEVAIGVVHGTDPAQVTELLLAVARAHPQVQAIPAPVALFRSVGENGLLFELRCWIDDFNLVLVVPSELTAMVHRALAEAGIAVALPQRAVRVTTAPPP